QYTPQPPLKPKSYLEEKNPSPLALNGWININPREEGQCILALSPTGSSLRAAPAACSPKTCSAITVRPARPRCSVRACAVGRGRPPAPECSVSGHSRRAEDSEWPRLPLRPARRTAPGPSPASPHIDTA